MAPSTSFEPFKIGERVISSQTELEVFLTPTYPDLRPPPPRRSGLQMTSGKAAINPSVKGAATRPTDASCAPHMRARPGKAASLTKPTKPFLPYATGKCNSRKTERQRERRQSGGQNLLRPAITPYTEHQDKWMSNQYKRYAHAHDGSKMPRAALLKAYNKRFKTERTLSGLSNHISHNEHLKQRIADAIRDGKPTKAKRGGMRSSRRA